LITLSEYGWGLRSSRFVAAPQHVVRRASVEDAEAIVQLGRVVDPDALATVEMFRRLLEREPAAATERLVAKVDGELAAWAPSGLFESGVGWLSGGVLPEHRRRGIGSGLFDRIESRLRGLGATKLEASATDDAGRRFLVARGFEATNVLHRSELDPRTAQAAAAPAGVDVAPLRDVLDRAEELYRLFAECRADVPAVDARTAWTYDEWRAQTLDLSLLDHDASVVLLDADEPVSFAWPCRIGREVGRRRSWPARAGTVAGRGS
jgi:N-acetylglutamate synthase-like GNAT family acetyltransferase